jgi:hypothetical protein
MRPQIPQPRLEYWDRICAEVRRREIISRFSSRRWPLLLVVAACFSGLVMAELSGDEAAPAPDAIVWPMLPGESLNQLAALFYPGNKAMQRRFVAKSIELSRDLDPAIQPNTVFSQPGTLLIPELKSLSSHAPPFKAHSGAQHLRMSYHIADMAKALVTPEMQAEYETLQQRNEFLKLELDKLQQRLARMQENLAGLETAVLAFIEAKPVAPMQARSAAPVVQPIVAKPIVVPPIEAQPVKAILVANPVRALPIQASQKPAQKHMLVGEESIESAWIRTLIQFVMIVVGLILAVAAWFWVRKRLFTQIKDVTNDQINAIGRNSSFSDISNSFDLTKSGIFEKEQDSALLIEEFDSVVEEAKILISMDRPAQAISVLLDHIGAEPKTSLHAWLYLLDIYRSQNQKEEFIALAKRLHTAFNVMTPQWEETRAAMVVANSIEEFPHIVSQLTEAWTSGNAGEYLASLLEDNREGERAGFSLEVLQEIMLLQGVWELRQSLAD